jgi:hypothetical protein
MQSEEIPGGIVLVESCDEFKQPIIHQSIERYDIQAIKKCLDLRSTDGSGFTPALLACSTGLVRPVHILLERKADFSTPL